MDSNSEVKVVNYTHGRGSVYALHYHLVLTVKYRKSVINDVVSGRLHSIATRIAKNHDCEITEWNHDSDHVHILFSAAPTTSLTKFINSYKSASSRLIKQGFPEITEQLHGSAFWSGSYFIASSGGVTLKALHNYVESQGG